VDIPHQPLADTQKSVWQNKPFDPSQFRTVRLRLPRFASAIAFIISNLPLGGPSTRRRRIDPSAAELLCKKHPHPASFPAGQSMPYSVQPYASADFPSAVAKNEPVRQHKKLGVLKLRSLNPIRLVNSEYQLK
jgi:hypothetical protein